MAGQGKVMSRMFLVALIASVLIAAYFSASSDSQQLAYPNGFSASGTIARHASSMATTMETPATEQVSPARSTQAELQERYQAISDNKNFPTLEQRIAELNQLYPYREFAPEEVVDLLAQSHAWQSATQVPDHLPINEAQRNDGRAFIELNPERFQVLLPGDTLQLPLEKLGMDLQMQVDSREPLANGGFTLHGHLVGSNELMRVTITQGPGLSLAGIDTPQGHIVMQANDSHGWIASSETLFKQDPHKTDILLPTNE